MVVVLLNLLLYRNSFCGIFRQASVLQASCRSASFQGMEVVKGSNKKKKRQIPGRAATRGCCFQLAAESLGLPHRSYRRSRDVFVSLCACFCLYLPSTSNERECSRFPGAFAGAAGGVGWRSAVRERPCPYPSLPFPLGTLRPYVETLESWSKVGWGGASTEVFGFHSVFPQKEYAQAVGTAPQRDPALWRPPCRGLLANPQTMLKPCSVGEPAAVPLLRAPGARR